MIVFKTCRAGSSATGETKFYRYPVLPVFRGTVAFHMTRIQRVGEKKVLGQKQKMFGSALKGEAKRRVSGGPEVAKLIHFLSCTSSRLLFCWSKKGTGAGLRRSKVPSSPSPPSLLLESVPCALCLWPPSVEGKKK